MNGREQVASGTFSSEESRSTFQSAVRLSHSVRQASKASGQASKEQCGTFSSAFQWQGNAGPGRLPSAPAAAAGREQHGLLSAGQKIFLPVAPIHTAYASRPVAIIWVQ